MTFLPDFILPPEEKAYVLYYVAQDHGEHGDVPPGPGISLDVSSDSDVIMELDPPATGNLKRASSATDDSCSKRRAAPSEECLVEDTEILETERTAAPAAPPSAPTQTQRRRPLSRFTTQEREKIVSICKQHVTVKKVLAELAVSVPNLTTQDPAADGYVSSFTIRHWVQDHGRLNKALELASRAPTPKVLNKSRAPPANSARAALPEPVREAIASALETARSEEDFMVALQETIPDFSDTDATAGQYIPRTTLKRWYRATGQDYFSDKQKLEQPETWESEFERTFCITFAKPEMRYSAVDPDDEVDQWLVRGSWTFCPKCGRRRPQCNVASLTLQRADKTCRYRCDPEPEDLLLPRTESDLGRHCKLDAYVTPNAHHWEHLLADLHVTGLPLVPGLTKKDLDTLAVLDLKIDYQTRRGGNAEITSKQKKSVIRGRWKALPLFDIQRSDQANRLFFWLLANNETYANWVQFHKQLAISNDNCSGPWQEVRTADLLLNSPGIEVAARPWLYPLASFGDTDLSSRLMPLKWIAAGSRPSLRASFLRKLMSRCIDYSRDFALKSLLYDSAMARTITSLISVANQRNIAPEFAAQQQDMFEGYWLLQLRKMEDICRREYESTDDLAKTFPNIFFTVAPAEWRYLLPEGLTLDDSLSEQQDLITLHMHHTLRVLLEHQLINHSDNLRAIGIANIRHWSFRFEFQARGTIHLHAVLWTDLLPGWSANDITARTGGTASPFLGLLEKLFKSRADVQCGDGTHCLMQYVAGYLLKASDALQFLSKQVDDQDTQWRQAYRLLCKRSPTEQEIVMEFAGLSMVKHSFSGVDIFAPIPGMLEERLLPVVPDTLKLPGLEDELARRRTFTAPCMCHHLKAVLSLDEFQLDGADPQVYNPDLARFFAKVEPELMLRGINADRISTFKAKIQATNLLLLRIRDGLEDAGFWTARDLPGYPRRQWSPEQGAVMEWMRDRLGVNDANDSRNRVLQISGPPGTGKTEVVIGATKLALDDDCRVLVAGPIGLLVAMYRLKLPADERLTMETIHSAFKITRPADAAYIPPGRLRRYDVIIFDEVSQIDPAVWTDLKAALGELHPGPLILFVGDFQQLQPVHGKPQLQIDLDAEVANGTVDRIDLKNHNLARSIDPDMLDFLTTVREAQPTRTQLEEFFAGRVWSRDLSEIAEKAKTWEDVTGKKFMFLTVVNK
ncbi:pif1, partial [Symbiodinium sp. CCMP2456]